MTIGTPIRQAKRKPSEEGYILVAVIFMVALLTISLSVALPQISKEIQRDRELETVQRGKQYARGVRMYFKKFGAYPPNVDAMINTNQVRFLRKKYKDPTTGKEEWKPIQFGQAKTQTLGFFGQPLAVMGMAGGTQIGGIVQNGGIGGGSMGGQNPILDSTPTPDPNNPTAPGASNPSNPSSPGSGTDSSSPTTFGTQAFGGMGIIGFSPTSPKGSILTWRKKNHYNEWEFIYDPMTERGMIPGNNGPQGGLQGGAPGMPGGVNLGAQPPVAAPGPSPIAPQP